MQPNQLLYRTIGVVVADSSPITSQLLADAVGRHRGIQILGFGSEAEKIFNSTVNRVPDVAVISARLGDDPNGGFVLLRKLRAERPTVKSIILLDSPETDHVVIAFRSGASGVLSKNRPVKMLCKCIRAVHEGQIWADSEQLRYLVAALSATPQVRMIGMNGMASLSKRERDVVVCLADGLTNRQIADRLKISPNTVKNYIFKVFEKLGVSSRLELASLVLRGSEPINGGSKGEPHSEKKQTSRTEAGVDPLQITKRLPQNASVSSTASTARDSEGHTENTGYGVRGNPF